MAKLNLSGKSRRARKLRLYDHDQDGQCCYCRCKMKLDAPLTDPALATFEHKRPVSAGGTLKDVALACKACNDWKADLTEAEFMRIINPA